MEDRDVRETRSETRTGRPGEHLVAGAGDPDSGERRERASMAQLVKDLRDESSTLLRQELALAKTEIGEKISMATRNTIYIAIGGVLATAGLIFLLLALTAGLQTMLVNVFDMAPEHAWWIAPVIVGVVFGLIGYAMIQKGISTLKSESMVPEKTVQSLEEDKQWLKAKTQA